MMKRRRSNDEDEEELSLKLSDKSVLDCPICLLPLTTPIFQCVNGHIICSSCHGRLNPKKCPSCSVNLGNLRNRALEKILESMKLSCLYKTSGCAAQLTYFTKLSHEQTCAYAPYDCPFKDCTFLGSQTELCLHLKNRHSSSVILNSILCTTGFNFDVSTSKSDGMYALLDKANEGPIFILNPRTMGISSILQPCLSKALLFRFTLILEHKSGAFTFQQDVRPWRNTDSAKPKDDVLPVLDPLFDRDGRIRLHINMYCSYKRLG